MARVYMFGDEGGDFVFTPAASRYFIIGTATMSSCTPGDDLLALRRELAWLGGENVLHEFHAANDKPRIRERVFATIADSDIRIDATILDKTKTQEHLRRDQLRFYKQAWYLHFKFVGQRIAQPFDELLVVASSLHIKRKKQAIHWAIKDVVQQVTPTTAVFHTAFCPAANDPCLQVADYVTWAIQRKYESEDRRSYEQIQHLIASEYEPFRESSTVYY